MTYEFIKYLWGDTIMLGVKKGSANSSLENLTSHDWTADKAQKIIEGVRKTITSGEEYKWANEDVFIVSNKDAGVLFWDTQSMRAGIKKEKQDLQMNFNDFIMFMRDFKKFIEENA